MIDERIKSIVEKYCVKNNETIPQTDQDYYDVIYNKYDQVAFLDRQEHRWWDQGTSIKKFDLGQEGIFYIGHDQAKANRDMSVWELGWQPDYNIGLYEPHEITTISYREV